MIYSSILDTKTDHTTIIDALYFKMLQSTICEEERSGVRTSDLPPIPTCAPLGQAATGFYGCNEKTPVYLMD